MSSEQFVAWVSKVDEQLERLEIKVEKLLKRENILNGEVLLDNQDLCFLLKVSKRSLQRYRSEKRLKYLIQKQKIYYYESDVQAFIRDNLSEITEDKMNQ